MTSEKSDNEIQNPIINQKPISGLTDYFCPFCNFKLFRGKVTQFNMVCSNCNKRVRSGDIKALTEPDLKNPDLNNPASESGDQEG